jgi:hypothetical protein
LLLRLLAADPAVACHDLYRLLLPSTTLRRVLGRTGHDWIARRFEPWFRALDGIHPVGLDQPEEDEILFLLLGNSGIESYLFPYGPEVDALAINRFWEWPLAKRDWFLGFYRRRVQQLLRETGAQRYLGKRAGPEGGTRKDTHLSSVWKSPRGCPIGARWPRPSAVWPGCGWVHAPSRALRRDGWQPGWAWRNAVADRRRRIA